jgi:hypothetical protein
MPEPTSFLDSCPWGLIPPYGNMYIGAMQTVHSHPQRPSDWHGDETNFQVWFGNTLSLISDLIWPIFDRYTRTWRGGAANYMLPLTIADLKLLRQIYASYPEPLKLSISSPLGMLGRKLHLDLFREEDLFLANWGTSYAHYDDNWEPAEIVNFQSILQSGVKNKVGAVNLKFKYLLQRPRPYQMSMLLDFHDFTYDEALSADTPSICCGHCLQSYLGVGAVFERLLQSGADLDSDRIKALQQFTADIGDRRVMARVHYPSDNVCSWLIALRMADHVFATPKVKEFMWKSIKHHSFVYHLIANSGETVYQKMIEAVTAEAEA